MEMGRKELRQEEKGCDGHFARILIPGCNKKRKRKSPDPQKLSRESTSAVN